MQDVEVLGKPHKVAVVAVSARATASGEVGGVRRPCSGLEDEGAELHGHIAVRYGAFAMDGFRRGGYCGLDHIPADMDHVVVFERCAAFEKKVARFGQQHFDTEVFKDGKCGLVHGLNPVVGEDLHWWERVFEVSVVHLAHDGRRGAPAPPFGSCVWFALCHPRIAAPVGS